MKWIKPTIAICVLLFFAVGVAACNSGEGEFSPQEVINTALKETDTPMSYYGEFTLQSNDDEGDYTAKEWVSKEGERRIEMTSVEGPEHMVVVNNGLNITMYDKASNSVQIMDMSEVDLHQISGQSPRQQAEKMLEMIKDSHELSIVGDEKIAGRDTYHISAKVKDTNTLFGDQELWVDKKTWMVLKSVSKSEQLVLTQEYTKIDFQHDLNKNVFVFDIPEGATVEAIDSESIAPKEATKEQVQEALGAYYQVPESNDLKLSTITFYEVLEERPEFSFDYMQNDIPAFSVTVFRETPDMESLDEMPNEDEIVIRGQKGSKLESGDFRLLNWEEAGLRYSVILENPMIEIDEVVKYLDDMKLVE
ncbi:outer membrane lipoprotein carrier protein LolA [Sporosarcina siberiensis]|uniref:Outer membrane lipoprotein carrier protein LolA n=1 Tax=Sporosarcina siberiensis TaxID=1365606 RepID=A0ABW4SFX0_9BACL